MNKQKIILFVAMALLLPAVALGATFTSGSNPTVGSSEIVSDDLYIAGSSVSVTGTIIGDLFAAGQSVLISNQVSQDLFSAGNNVVITANVDDDVKIIGNTVFIQGNVGGDAMIGGNQITVSGGQVGGDLLLGGNSINVEASVRGKARIAGALVYINSTVTGDIIVDATQLKLGPKAVISGNLTYRSPNEMSRDSEAKILGTVSYESKAMRNESRPIKAFISFWLIMKALMMIVLVFLMGIMFRRYSVEAVETAFKSPWAALGKGFVTVIILPVISILLLVTVVGIPLGILGIISIVALSILSCALTPIFIGSLLYKWLTKKTNFDVSWKTMLIGVAAYIILWFIPFVGYAVISLFSLTAIGTAVSLKLRMIKELR
ncbi:MAG: hypothetical protein UW46_C0006G0010 [Candidatus Yanofskybacteria bacterium GW2011_GWF1_44_227]|uniref:DUF8173 domain-containing protein n=1 Tax=Candidatus Yanofskybacteria bacterium GW2011_GWE2_40_11 TaxID=1619033 RepID=A0A0G0QKS5_9BACT|nr:MAG: hypothetical protein UT69_C0002G0005 [Candidatus Yanofskybacteria bacterium GW2011_GWE1_40_10]KKR41024.1 MAG: hypothetical protein UT75_C0002G0061 [Candidatus Yanofskybacteria bacterium GW2011_GWE2_40_11]KKT15475.1 MAG: hypothetical protein UV97_C0006G0042 [Candidatus Yanofskybacteria bacterium GW2011_GWF2_43_596]KKT53109.1 MAG: hypothetical protein UW46_C0006G0010 [Candidatus Yanofskybacteria bacterium GW2011_GWF1_44_227]OGN35539.1 MAG: hypothetical protein A2207_02245 [Candidatus Yano